MFDNNEIEWQYELASIVMNVTIAAIISFVIFMLIHKWNYKNGRPTFLQMFFERMYVDLDSIAGSLSNKRVSDNIVKVGMVLVTFIGVSSIMSIINIPILFDSEGVAILSIGAPTVNLAVTAGLSLYVTGYCVYLGFKHQKFGYALTLMTVSPIFTLLLNAFTLALRLLANMFAGSIIGSVVAIDPNGGIVSFIGAMLAGVVGSLFGLMTGTIQAYVFALLSIVYMAETSGAPNVEKQREIALMKEAKINKKKLSKEKK